MSEPYVGEIRMFSFPFAPRGWAFCQGQILPINQNQALYAILGNRYGGDGRTTFALPDLRGRTPVHVGGGVTLAQSAGEENHTLTINEMPQHMHLVAAGGDATTSSPVNGLWGVTSGNNYSFYGTLPDTSMNQAAISVTGKSQPHPNMQPYTTLNFCIALVGEFPSQN